MLNELTLNDKELFQKFEKEKQTNSSDNDFINLYIWADYYNAKWQIYENMLFNFAHPPNEKPFAFQPLGEGNLTKAISFIKDNLAEPLIKRATLDFVEKVKDNFDVNIEHDINNDDYVYLTQQFITLAGRKMGQKRNHHNYFINNYEYELLPISAEMHSEIFNFTNDLMKTYTDDLVKKQLATEYKVIEKLLNNLDVLEQKSLVIKINGKIEAYSIANNLGKDMAVIHIEKGNPEIRGLHVALAKQMCEKYFSELKYVNREQDLGLEGLRKSKKSYHPVKMIEKYTITFN